MEPVFFFMAILGCGEADTACRQVAVVPQRYENAAACNAATPDALAEHSDIAFPVVVAQCQRADAKLGMTITPDDVKLPEGAPPERERSRPRHAIQTAALDG